MGEKLLVSGRNIAELYPHVNAWGFGIPLYLFIGGLAAGILLFSSFYFLRGKADEMPVTVKISTIIPPFIIALGLLFLVGDLHHKPYFWRLMTTFEWRSPMSWGAWILVVVFTLSIFWPLGFLSDMKEFFEKNNRKRWAKWMEWTEERVNKIGILKKLVDFSVKYRKQSAILLIIFGIALGIYTGILLSAFNARPLWNNPVLGLLFLTSGVSTGAAAIMWLSNDHKEKLLFSKIDLGLITTELLLIFLMFLAMSWGSDIQQKAAEMFLGGEFTAIFWGLFVFVGLVVPAIMEIAELKGYKVPVAIPAAIILTSGLIFRIIMVIAGQISSYTF